MVSPLQTLRHSAAELLACAVCDHFPGAKLVAGDVSEIGFSYDFVIAQPIDEQAIVLLEEKVRTLIKDKRPIKILDMMRENAAGFFLHRGQSFKAEQISAAPENIVAIFQMGEFHDYAPGKHVSQSNECGAIKILEIEAATVHLPASGDIQVTRFTGTAFENSHSLKEFLKRKDDAKKRDHRILGNEMHLYSLHEEVGGTGWFWHPKGAIVREILLDWWRQEHRNQGFQPLVTPRVVKPALLKKAGFFDVPQESTPFPNFPMDGVDYTLTPCQGIAHAWIFRSELHSYRELPIKFAEYGEVFNGRKPSQLWGMLRAREYCADIAHLFCTPGQVFEELISSLQFIYKTVNILGFECLWYLVPRGPKYAGTLNKWDQTLDWIVKALKTCGFDYKLDHYGKSFAGPRVDVRLIDALGREWNGPHLAVDFNLPEQFGLRYQGPDDEMHMPVMLSRSMFGSLERFVAILVEHYAGMFPLWLAPEQVRVIPVGERNQDYAGNIRGMLQNAGLRVGSDFRHGTLGAKVHAAERAKVPYVLIIGDKENKNGTITVRACNQEGTTAATQIEPFLQGLQDEIAQRTLPLRKK